MGNGRSVATTRRTTVLELAARLLPWEGGTCALVRGEKKAKRRVRENTRLGHEERQELRRKGMRTTVAARSSRQQ